MVDTSLVPHTPTSLFFGLPFTEYAKERIGNPMTLNTIVLGAITHILPFAEARLMRKALEENLPPKIHEINIKAFNLGHRQAKKAFGEAPSIWKSAEEHATEEEAGFED